MAELRQCLEKLGFTNVSTYIASGNVIVQSDKKPRDIQAVVETMLLKTFVAGEQPIKVLVLSHSQLKQVIASKPKGFGDTPGTYLSDVIFLMDAKVSDALAACKPREGVDMIWPGDAVIYSQRLSALRTKSRLSAIVQSPLYTSMTIRNWNTVVALQTRAEQVAAALKSR